MISAWGVDHGAEEVSKGRRLALYGGGALGGAAVGATADKIASKTDKDYKTRTRKDPVTHAAVSGLTGTVAGTYVGGPRVGLGAGVGTAATMYALNRKKKNS